MDDITKTPKPAADLKRPFDERQAGELHRHFGLLHATALNVSMIVGAGVFVTIPFMLVLLPGPYALLGWVGAGLLIIFDGLVWSELGAMMPGSGGTYLYLLEAFGRNRWGRLAAFLFIWQFLISGPLEIASGLIAMATFSLGLHPDYEKFNNDWTREFVLLSQWDLKLVVGPARLAVLVVGVLLVFLLYRRITTLGKLTLVVWLGVLGVSAWILVEGFLHFDAKTAFALGDQAALPPDFVTKLGGAMILAMYSYLGYYHICYMGDEVREPGRTIPRSILLSAVLVCVLFVALHLAMMGTISWSEVPREGKELDDYNLTAAFMKQIYKPEQWPISLIAFLLMGSCFASAFAGLLGYSRIPYGAARFGHFYEALAAVHPKHRIPHISLFAVGGLTLCWVFFDLQKVINALITTRILEQFVAQIIGVMILRRTRPDWPRPYRIWLYPLPCVIALIGWLYLYWSAEWFSIVVGLVSLLAGLAAFILWTLQTNRWPFTKSVD
jgi:basic amino acid/polyamine antiporter, APA family